MDNAQFNKLEDFDILVRKMLTWLKVASKYSKNDCSQTLDIYCYLTPHQKILPNSQLTTLSPHHVNSAVTTSCSRNGEICLFRIEELFKVFIHETFHNLGLDFSTSSTATLNAQTKEHAFLARVLGVTQLIVNVNKMDISGVSWSEDKYNKTCEEVSELLKVAGFNPKDVPMIPCSSFDGDNVYHKSDKAPWYSGPTLFEAIDKVVMPPKPSDKPLRLPIQDVYKIGGIGTVPVGKVETGLLHSGKTVVFNPSEQSAEVKSIEMHHTIVERAQPGDNVGFNVRGLAVTDIRRGDVAGYGDTAPVFVRHDETFVGNIQIMDIPKAISVGYTPVFHCHTSQVAVKFVELMKNLKDGTTPSFLKTGDAATVRFQPTKPMAIETKDDFPELCRFAIRDMGKTVAAGMCIAIQKK